MTHAVTQEAGQEMLARWCDHGTALVVFFGAAGGTANVAFHARVHRVSAKRLLLRSDNGRMFVSMADATFSYGPANLHSAPTLAPVAVDGLHVSIGGEHSHWLWLANAGEESDKLLAEAAGAE